MRVLLVAMIMVLTVNDSTPANAQACGRSVSAGALNRIVSLLGPVAKELSYYENIRLKCSGAVSCRWETKCKTADIIDKVEKAINLLCSILEAQNGGAMTSAASAIMGEMNSIVGNMTSIMMVDRASITTQADLNAKINAPVDMMDSSLARVRNMLPSVNGSEQKQEWVRWSRRSSCTTKGSHATAPPVSAADQAQSAADEAALEAAGTELHAAKTAVEELVRIVVILEGIYDAKVAAYNTAIATGLGNLADIQLAMDRAKADWDRAEAELAAAQIRLTAADANMDAIQRSICIANGGTNC